MNNRIVRLARRGMTEGGLVMHVMLVPVPVKRKRFALSKPFPSRPYPSPSPQPLAGPCIVSADANGIEVLFEDWEALSGAD